MKASVVGLLSLLVACGADPGTPFISGPRDAGAATETPGPTETGDAPADPTNPGGPDAGDGGAATAGPPADPAKDGPFEVEERSGKAAERNVRAFYPKEGVGPVVVFGHGMQIPPSQYTGYLRRLATFGYVAMTVDFEANLGFNDNTAQAKELIAGIDWAKTDDKVSPHADTSQVGMSGHSLGGKIALLAASLDARVKAAIVLDPVDGGPACFAPSCVTVADKLPALKIPTAYLGETLDGTALGQACAPTDANFMTFYAKANAPKLAVTVTDAGHMSFIDNRASCGAVCNLCKTPQATQADVLAIARAYVVSFYERHLRGDARYDAYLTGDVAEKRWVEPKKIAIEAE